MRDFMTSLIRGLCEKSSGCREVAARQVFDFGRKRTRLVLGTWFSDPEMMQIVGLSSAAAQPWIARMVVGVAVEPGTFREIRAANAWPPLAKVPPDQDVEEFELVFPVAVRLDILTTRRPNGRGAIARYLRRFGEGIQQVEIHVPDVEGATQLLGARFGVPPVYRAPRAGAAGARVNFFLVPAVGGGKILIELVEAPRYSPLCSISLATSDVHPV